MTLKQINAAIKTHTSDLKECIKTRDEWVREGVHPNIIADQERWIAYHQKRIDALTAQIYDAQIAEEEKMLKKIAKEQVKAMASTIQFIQKGNDIFGITPNGKRWYADHNWWGLTERTLHCYTLRIDGKVIFTSGTLDTVLQTVAQN